MKRQQLPLNPRHDLCCNYQHALKGEAGGGVSASNLEDLSIALPKAYCPRDLPLHLKIVALTFRIQEDIIVLHMISFGITQNLECNLVEWSLSPIEYTRDSACKILDTPRP